jgi:hypothetical protein
MAHDSLAASGRSPVPTDDSLERARWYRSSGAAQRCGEYLSNELADNTTSKFLK